VLDDSAGDSPAGIVGINLDVKAVVVAAVAAVQLGKEDSGRVVGEPRVEAGPNLSLEARGGVVVGVEVVDKDVPVDVTTSKSVIRMAGQSSGDGSRSSPTNRPQSCPMMWIRDPARGCLMFPKR
jgi:hypothetical protein